MQWRYICQNSNDFQVSKVTTFPLSVNKVNFDHLIYELQDNHNVFNNNIKLKTLTLKSGLNLCCVSWFSDWVYSFKQIKCHKIRFYFIVQVLFDCPTFIVLIQNGCKSCSCMISFNHYFSIQQTHLNIIRSLRDIARSVIYLSIILFYIT